MDFAGVDERIRVVVVDDVVDHAEGLAARLEQEGFDTRAVYEAAEFLALRQTFKPHCVLFDIVMPGIDGLELAKQLRASNGDDVILLAMTGKDIREMRVADTFKLVDHYFEKPVAIASLLKVLLGSRDAGPSGKTE